MSPASVSCLVVSRTPALLNRFLASLEVARRFWGPHDKVLCSWNGSTEDEALIADLHTPTFCLAQRSAYHFAANMNGLAAQATGDILAILNDDVVLDTGSLDRAIQILCSHPEVGIVGGRLRTSDGRLSHAGILFDNDHRPYNRFRPDRLGQLIDANGLEVQESGAMPAVTGALMVIRREDFERVRFRETFRVCGEDVALCLDLLQHSGKAAYYASDVTAIHDEKSTRGDTLDHYDLEKVAALVTDHSGRNQDLRSMLAHWSLQEADLLEGVIHGLRQQAEVTHQDWLDGVLEDKQQQLHQLRLDLELTRQQVQALLHREFQRQLPRRVLARCYFWLFGWLGGVGRRS